MGVGVRAVRVWLAAGVSLAVLAGLSASLFALSAHREPASSSLFGGPPKQAVHGLKRLTPAAQPAIAATSGGPPKQAVHALESLPPAAQTAVAATLGADDRRYHARSTQRGFRVANAVHGITADFLRDDVRLRGGTDRLALTLERAGYGGALAPLAAARPFAASNRVEYRRGPVTEWYVNGPLGLEQGFTIATPLASRGNGPLTLVLRTQGSLRPTLADGRRSLDLVDETGGVRLRYQGLVAFDARGKALRSWLDVDQRTVVVRVDEAGARYPLTIDPLIVASENKLQASDGAASDQLGISAAIDGDTVVVGAYLDDVGANVNQGSAYVFTRSGTAWTQQAEADGGGRRGLGPVWHLGRDQRRHCRRRRQLCRRQLGRQPRVGLRVLPVGHDVEPAGEVAGRRRHGWR